MSTINLNINQCLTLEEIHYLLHNCGDSSDFSKSRKFDVNFQLSLPSSQQEVISHSVEQDIISIYSDLTSEDVDSNEEVEEILPLERIEVLEESSETLCIEQNNVMTNHNLVCCICQEKPKLACYPYGCNESHTMCYPECVSHYAYVSRFRSIDVKCPCCRKPFHYLNVIYSSDKSPMVRIIPYYPDIIRSQLREEERNEGCNECWGIYHPNPVDMCGYYFHSRKKGHRGRHTKQPVFHLE